ncbi:PLP-dependent aminotransferase family protein [Eubacterium xylanophilum]|uniref:MocR-like pyridoxine biosynthesis transcription factor PdxR n=1 Tax=Eubacterium xylanophilum TaxID=39497 RepID=UPI00047C9A63|nr:PLP-dependent aminotransferase family protein [Eubacterium xylanophilum]
MFTFIFDNDSKVSLYEQLYTEIKNRISSGAMKPGEKLPSKRNLAKQLSISVITIENAYNQLLSEGFIYSLPRKGFFVNDIFEGFIPQSPQPPVVRNIEKKPSYFADFSSNSTETSTFPFSTWAKITRKVLANDRALLLENSPSNGIEELRICIANYLSEFRGIHISPDNIVIGAGSEAIYHFIIQILGRQRVYACENPGYAKVANILSANDVNFYKIPMDSDGIIPAELYQNDISVVHVTPSHHFPTGITMPIKRRYELLKWANAGTDSKRIIIEDEYDSEFRHTGRPIPSLFSIGSENVIYINTFTKSLASTIRISYMVLPDHFMQVFRDNLSFYSCTVSTFEQLTLARFISEGYFEKHLNRMRNISKKKRDTLLSCLAQSPLGPIIRIHENQSGLHFLMDIDLDSLGITDRIFTKKCSENHIKIKTVSNNTYMINYSSIPLENIPQAVELLSEGLK